LVVNCILCRQASRKREERRRQAAGRREAYKGRNEKGGRQASKEADRQARK